MRSILTLTSVFLLGWMNLLEAEDLLNPSVGMPGHLIEKVLPGTELEVIPREDDRIPLVLRIAEIRPHGDSFRYHLIFTGLDPGNFDLKDYLQRKDGSSKDDLPELKVTVRSLLEPGQVLPSTIEPANPARVGGYRWLLIALGVIWVIGLLFLLFACRKKLDTGTASATERPKTFAERIRPLVEKARKGELDTSEQAQLERTLLGFWRNKLGLQEESNFNALQKLREHDEAGNLLRALEGWLHRPPGQSDNIDVAALLAPYDQPDS